MTCRGSSVVERSPEEAGVVSSILTLGTNLHPRPKGGGFGWRSHASNIRLQIST